MNVGALVKVAKHMGTLAIMKEIGYDFVLLDNEHGFYSFQELHDLSMYAKSIQLNVIVRISEISKTEICKTLDAGATGILVPMVEHAAQVAEIVQFAKYPPLGVRGYAGGANTIYRKAITHQEAIAEANATCKVYVQIETLTGVQHAAELAVQEYLDGIVIGPADLAISLGHPGDVMREEQLAIMKNIADLCDDQSIEFGIIGKEAMIQQFQDQVQFAVSAIDTDILYQGLQKQRELWKK